ncbi:uncharacterized protein LOC132042134 [Lycium ferocissimum]|uniref:uncharacterized protein LOC132042134 n=1 Tax=Lycium ferocissimum TaxID=112874 RepID=UPI002814C467|nr:uncharacterized protein LOC132042134 [Lycium ferocissimum]
MSISLDALAMMGADYLKDGMSMEEFEKHEAQVPPYLLADHEEEEDENLFSTKKNIHHDILPTKKQYEYSFCSQEFHRCENDEGDQKKPLLIRNNILGEFLKKKDIGSFLETSRNSHCIMSL